MLMCIYVSSERPQAELESLHLEPYVVLKFCTCDYVNRDAAQHEVEVYKHLSVSNPSHSGLPYIQSMVESFEVTGPNGTHFCLVFQPMRGNLSLFQSRLKKQRLTLELLKMYLVCLLHGLDYLHSECHVVHAGELKFPYYSLIIKLTQLSSDLKMDNILLSFENESVLEDFVTAQCGNPMLHKRRNRYSIYESHNQFGPFRVRLGPIVPVIADFGHAQWIDDAQPQINPIQPDYYRAPEVILGTGWGPSADIWNLGALVRAQLL